MPRLVVPRLLEPSLASMAPSRSLCQGITTWQRPETLSASQLIPSASSMSISETSTSGSTMQPLPMMGTTPFTITPDGIW